MPCKSHSENFVNFFRAITTGKFYAECFKVFTKEQRMCHCSRDLSFCLKLSKYISLKQVPHLTQYLISAKLENVFQSSFAVLEQVKNNLIEIPLVLTHRALLLILCEQRYSNFSEIKRKRKKEKFHILDEKDF